MWNSASTASSIATGHYLPTNNAVFDLGSSSKYFRDLNLSRNIIGSGALTLKPRNSTARNFIFDAANDNAHDLYFGDAGTTASQTLTIRSNADGATYSRTILLSTNLSVDSAKGAFLRLYSQLAGSGSVETVCGNSGIYLIYPKGGGTGGYTRVFKLNASSDTDHLLQFGDTTTNSQILTIGPSADGAAEERSLYISGHNSAQQSKGAYIRVTSNLTSGNIELRPGNGSGGATYIYDPLGNQAFAVSAGANFYSLSTVTGGGNFIFSNDNTGVAECFASGLTSTGTVLADALQLTKTFSVINTVAAGTGVKLLNCTNGITQRVLNRGANDLKVYPDSASGQINGASLGAAATIASGAMGCFTKTALNVFWAVEIPAS